MIETGKWRGGRSAEVLLAVASLAGLALSHEIAARAATGLGSKLLGGIAVIALQGLMTLFLVVIGLQLLGERVPSSAWLEKAGLIRRSTAAREWALGVAVAWGLVVLSVLPLAIFRSMQVSLWLGWRAVFASLFSVVGVAATSLAVELVYRGFAFTRLAKGVGRASSVILLVLVYGSVYGRQSPRAFLVACALSALFFTGWFRTHAVWMSWGLHLGWDLGLGLVFGLPLAEGGDISGIVLAQVRRGLVSFPVLGPSGMVWTSLVLLIGIAALVSVTREYAWEYTHPPIVAGGYPMEPTPPPAHVAMQASVSVAASPLIQIARTQSPRGDVGATNHDPEGTLGS